MHRKKHLATFLVVIALALTGLAASTATASQAISAVINTGASPNSVKTCSACEVLPAVPTTTTKKNASSSSSKQITIIAKKTLTEQVSQYQ